MMDARPHIPLRLRLPNPPPVFVGRADALAWLAEAVPRAPCAVVWGLGGVGKTALVLQALHARFAEQAQRALWVSCRPRQGEPVLERVLRALAEVSGAEHIPWAKLRGDREAMVGAAIDLADRDARWLVIDDAHHAEPEALAWLLEHVSRYARDSRWIITSRRDPGAPALLGQTLALSALSGEAMRALAAAWCPGASLGEVEPLVARASGSPWRLRRLIMHRSVELADALDADLPPLALDALGLLRSVARPVPVGLLAEACAASEAALEAVMALALDRGLVERTAQGVRLHEVARPLVQRSPEPDQRARLVGALERSPRPELRLEALALCWEAGASDAVERALSRDGARWLARGYGPRLLALLDIAQAPRLRYWRDRIAADGGDVALLKTLDPPRDPSPLERAAWGLVCFARADYGEAVAALSEAPEGADPVFVGRVKLSHARALCATSAFAAALEALDRAAFERASDALMAASLRGLCYVRLGRMDEAVATLDGLRARLHAVPVAARVEVALNAIWLLYALQRMHEAQRVLDALEQAREGSDWELFGRRDALFVRATLGMVFGRLDEAMREVTRLERFVVVGSRQWMIAQCLRATVELYAGALQDAEASCAAVLQDPPRAHEGTTGARLSVEAVRARLCTARFVALPDDAAAGAQPEDRAFVEQLSVYHAEHRLRRGDTEALAAVEGIDAHPGLALSVALLRAQRALLLGDAPRAFERSRAVADEALNVHGLVLIAVDALLVAHDAALVSAPPLAAARAVNDQLADWAETMPSPRLAAFAAFGRAAQTPSGLAPEALERWAQLAHAPTVARRACVLLGARATPHDHVDAAVCQALRARGAPEITTLGEQAGGGGWGIDRRRRCVWLPDGAVVELARFKVLWGMLEALAARGGAATKEQLLRDAWSITAYHPLRHDNRLRTAVRKLRKHIPEGLVLTQEDGYRLHTPFRIV